MPKPGRRIRHRFRRPARFGAGGDAVPTGVRRWGCLGVLQPRLTLRARFGRLPKTWRERQRSPAGLRWSRIPSMHEPRMGIRARHWRSPERRASGNTLPEGVRRWGRLRVLQPRVGLPARFRRFSRHGPGGGALSFGSGGSVRAPLAAARGGTLGAQAPLSFASRLRVDEPCQARYQPATWNITCRPRQVCCSRARGIDPTIPECRRGTWGRADRRPVDAAPGASRPGGPQEVERRGEQA